MKKKTFSAAIVDIVLPDLRGEALLEAFKKQWPVTEVIMITGAEDDGIAQTCFEKGAFDFFSKPIDLKKLNRSLRRAVELSEMTRALNAVIPVKPVKPPKGRAPLEKLRNHASDLVSQRQGKRD